MAYDRRLGFYFGVAASEAVFSGYFGNMVALKNGRLILSPIREAVKELSTVNVDLFLYDKEKYRPRYNILGVLGPILDPAFRS